MDLASKGADVKTVAYGFDCLNRLSTVTDAIGTTSYTYDAVGNQTRFTDANGNTISYEYDVLDRRTKTTFAPVGNEEATTKTVEYDGTSCITGLC